MQTMFAQDETQRLLLLGTAHKNSKGRKDMSLSYMIETLGQVCLGICFLYMAVLVYFFVIDGVFRGGFQW